MTNRLTLLLGLLLITTAAGCGGEANVVTEQELGPERQVAFICPPEGRPIRAVPNTYVQDVDGRKRVIFRGKAGPVVDEIADYTGSGNHWCLFLVSPDGRRIGYVARVGQQWHAFIDQVSVGSYETAPEGLQFSPDGGRYSYTVRTDDDHQFVVIDGKQSRNYWTMLHERINVAFSHDGKRCLYACRVDEPEREDDSAVVVDGLMGPRYESIAGVSYDWKRRPAFSPDGRRYAYIGKRDNIDHLVVDGKEMASAASIDAFTFSLDGANIFYWTGYPGTAHMDGRALRPNEFIFPIPDLGGIVEPARLVTLKRPLPPEAELVALSPDLRHYAYSQKGEQKRARLVMDEQPGPWFETVGGNIECVYFSPDSSRLTYYVQQEDGQFTVIDGKEGPRFKTIFQCAFSPDSRRLYYFGELENEDCQLMEVDLGDGRRAPVHRVVTTIKKPGGSVDLLFSGDGKHWGYVYEPELCEYTRCTLVWDGKEIAKGIFNGNWSTTQTGVEALFIREGKWYKVTVTGRRP